MGLRRIATAGSVDDGKSTLIGRLLLDGEALFDDQLDALMRASGTRNRAEINLAFVTDGLKLEREKAITVDVAYRYFGIGDRRFILADCPGHLEYLRNLATGMSLADAALILIDSSRGVGKRTLAHLGVAALLRVPVVLCINKMDKVGYARAIYDRLVGEASGHLSHIGGSLLHALPLCALTGENVSDRAMTMPWYGGPTLQETIAELPRRASGDKFRLRVQHCSGRGLLRGTVSSGTLAVGDRIQALPDGEARRVSALFLGDRAIERAECGAAVTFALAGVHEYGAGTIFCAEGEGPRRTRDVDASLIWFGAGGPSRDSTYLMHGALGESRCRVDDVRPHRSFEADWSDAFLEARLVCDTPMVFDAYSESRDTGAFIVIDERTGETVGAGVL